MTTTVNSERAFIDFHRFTWPTLANGESGDSVGFMAAGDRTVQVDGTFGAGGSVNIEGSNDGTTWYVLRDPQAVALTFTAAGFKQILENPAFIRPRITAGDGATSLKITLVVRRSNDV